MKLRPPEYRYMRSLSANYKLTKHVDTQSTVSAVLTVKTHRYSDIHELSLEKSFNLWPLASSKIMHAVVECVHCLKYKFEDL